MPKSILLALVFLAGAAGAADLDQAKRDGLIGERADGYLGLVDESAPADVRALVAEINEKRSIEYQRIAKANDISVEQVQVLAGKKAIEKTHRGHYILQNGGWERK